MDVQLELLLLSELQLVVYYLHWKKLPHGNDKYFLINFNLYVHICLYMVTCHV